MKDRISPALQPYTRDRRPIALPVPPDHHWTFHVLFEMNRPRAHDVHSTREALSLGLMKDGRDGPYTVYYFRSLPQAAEVIGRRLGRHADAVLVALFQRLTVDPALRQAYAILERDPRVDLTIDEDQHRRILRQWDRTPITDGSNVMPLRTKKETQP